PEVAIALAKSHPSSSAFRLRGMTKVHEPRRRSENTQVATAIHDVRRDVIAFQNLNRATDGETFRDPAETNQKGRAKTDTADSFKNDIAPAAPAVTRTVPRKIIPFHQLPGHCDVENAISVAIKFLCEF